MRVLRALGKSAVTTVIFFLLLELALRAAYAARNAFVEYVPLPYVVGDDYGPIPPWLDKLLILKPDDALIWKNLPNARRTYVDIFTPVWTDADRMRLLRRFLPSLPEAFRGNPKWRIALNEEGFRTATIGPKRAGVTRIACIGDSWTFGMNVDQDQTYPARLEAAFKQQGRDVEVMNFGVLGYSSFQGLELLKRHVLDLQPDVLVIGFAMNDSDVGGYRDKDVVQPGQVHWRDRLKAIAGFSESYALLKYTALLMRFRSKPVGDFLKGDAKADAGKNNDTVNYDEMEPWTRVSPHDYDANVREMVRLARGRGARVVLLDNELWPESPYRPVLRAISRDADVPLVDSLRIIQDERARIEREMEERFRLEPSQAAHTAAGPPKTTTVVIRVFEGAYSVSRHLSIAGNHPQLGDSQPNLVALRDDGAEGDERAGDRVWSTSIVAPAGTRVKYVYTNSGAAGRWEGLDVPHIREFVVPSSPDGRPVYRPIESFGRIYMQADNWHTDAAGYDLIARAVAEFLK